MNKCLIKLTSIAGIALSLSGCQTITPTGPRQPLPEIDHIVVDKGQRTLSVYSNKTQMAQYRISLGKSPVGHKQKEGDHKTPEGTYTICKKNPHDRFFKSLMISYPNKQDTENAARQGCSTGGGIKIHGYEPHLSWVSQNHPLIDATKGCILLTNPEMEQIYNATKVGTKIQINP